MSLLDRVLFIVLAVAWIWVGWASHTSAILAPRHHVWFLASAFAAGSAVAVARYASLYALRLYLAVTAIVAVSRSIVYARADAWNPMGVWTIVLCTSLIAYAEVRQKATK